MRFSHYKDANLQRLVSETRRSIQLVIDRVKYLETLATWIRDDLYPAHVAAATAAGTTPASAPPEP